jgi:hypothetical protein
MNGRSGRTVAVLKTKKEPQKGSKISIFTAFSASDALTGVITVLVSSVKET